MPRLSELFQRSAFRYGVDRSVKLPTVFDVGELLIPAGTDWSEFGYSLGRLSPISWGNFIPYKLFIEVAEPVVDQVRLTVDDNPNYSVSQSLTSARLLAGDRWSMIPLSDSPTDLLTGDGAGNVLTGGGHTAALPELAETLYVSIVTPAGPTTEDITVIGAHAEFLLN